MRTESGLGYFSFDVVKEWVSSSGRCKLYKMATGGFIEATSLRPGTYDEPRGRIQIWGPNDETADRYDLRDLTNQEALGWFRNNGVPIPSDLCGTVALNSKFIDLRDQFRRIVQHSPPNALAAMETAEERGGRLLVEALEAGLLAKVFASMEGLDKAIREYAAARQFVPIWLFVVSVIDSQFPGDVVNNPLAIHWEKRPEGIRFGISKRSDWNVQCERFALMAEWLATTIPLDPSVELAADAAPPPRLMSNPIAYRPTTADGLSKAAGALGQFLARALRERDAITRAAQDDAGDEELRRNRREAQLAAPESVEWAAMPAGRLAQVLSDYYPSTGPPELSKLFHAALLALPTHEAELRAAYKAHQEFIECARKDFDPAECDFSAVLESHCMAMGELVSLEAVLGEHASPADTPPAEETSPEATLNAAQSFYTQQWIAKLNLFRDLFPFVRETLIELAGLPRECEPGPPATHEQNTAFLAICDQWRQGTRSGNERITELHRRATDAWHQLTGLPTLGTEEEWQSAAAAAGVLPADYDKKDFREIEKLVRTWALGKKASHHKPADTQPLGPGNANRKVGGQTKRRRRAPSSPKPLTKKQQRALELYAEHSGDFPTIAAELGVSQRTARGHVAVANAKLGKTIQRQNLRTTQLPIGKRGEALVAEGDDRRKAMG